MPHSSLMPRCYSVLLLMLDWKSVCLFQIFAGIFPKNYEPPPGDFYFEVDDDSPVVQVAHQN
jgi:hypothetical protein